MPRHKLRLITDHRMIIDLSADIKKKLLKLMRKQGWSELKPYLEQHIMEIVLNAEKEGEI